MRSNKRGKAQSIVQTGQTLHHFFKTAAQQKLDKSNNNSSRASTSQEVIVIDSDDDDRVDILKSTKPVKRRRLSADSCSNQNLDDDVIPLTLSQSSPISPVKLSNSGEYVHSGVEAHNSPVTTETKPVLSFGSPVLRSLSSCKEPAQRHSFGKPSALLQGNPAGKMDAGHSQHPSFVTVSEERPTFSQTDDVDIDLTLEDWENQRPFEFKTEDDWMIPGNANNVSYVYFVASRLLIRSF